MKLKKGLEVILEDAIEMIPYEFRAKELQGYVEFWIDEDPLEICIETPAGGIICSLPHENTLDPYEESEYTSIKIERRKEISKKDLIDLINRSTNNRKEITIYSHGIDLGGNHQYCYPYEYIKDDKRGIWIRAKTNPRFYYDELLISIAERVSSLPKRNIEQWDLLRDLYACFREKPE